MQARITTKYNIPNLDSPKYANKKRKRTAAAAEGEGEEDKKKAEDAPPRVPRATLEVKAYDPASGVTLKFKTEKSQDVGRLFAGLGRIGRHMAALPEKVDGMWEFLFCTSWFIPLLRYVTVRFGKKSRMDWLTQASQLRKTLQWRTPLPRTVQRRRKSPPSK